MRSPKLDWATRYHDASAALTRVADAFGTRGVDGSYPIDARGMIRFAHEGWDDTADEVYRGEIKR
jgi:hypothetical protein